MRVMLHTRWSAEAWFAGPGRVQEGARAEESDPAGGLVQLVLFNAPAVSGRPRLDDVLVRRPTGARCGLPALQAARWSLTAPTGRIRHFSFHQNRGATRIAVI
jgi:hypothetical protein